MERFQNWIVSCEEDNEALCRIKILPLCNQLAETDMVFSWHKIVEVEFAMIEKSKPAKIAAKFLFSEA